MAGDSEWTKQTYKLPDTLMDGLGRIAKPGCNIFVGDRGAVSLQYPRTWLVRPGKKGSIKFSDVKPPNESCRFEMTVMRLPPVKGGWGVLPVKKVAEDLMATDHEGRKPIGELVTETRLDLELAWFQMRYTDPKDKRQIRCRTLIARNGLIQPIITFEFYEDEMDQWQPVWQDLLATLKVGMDLTRPPGAGLPGFG